MNHNVGELINSFDNLEHTTVERFNQVFYFAKIDTKRFNLNSEVEILEPIGSSFRRISIDGFEYIHNFNN